MKKVIFNNKKYTLFANPIKKNGHLFFTGTNLNLKDEELKSEHYTLVSSFPSISTNICDSQVKWLSEIAEEFPKLSIVAISNDLPFTLGNWCALHSVKNIKVFSDHLHHGFGYRTGLLIKELNLLARSIILINSRNRVVYLHINVEQNKPLPLAEIKEKLRKFAK
ncbi:thiol peroxidase [Mycoplasmopsis californica]|uniref:Redoxin domain-containing protein n=1 Tax=Mycoplasmopsis equigenitalium TaxID=114883 RepID=A0ABY5J134_9BACT|nr:redoxin family protein [Mycoplasmopsis equigenitalium]UUD36965.1 redoxin domain-containing protein [Mycoplasmopsis equigenitalium]VEU69740.1 thiol peroxidase [Mycoplasmopsis californica]